MEKTVFKGLAGAIDCVLEWPESEPRGWALVLHPHPLHGGARDNKIVTTIARACLQDGLVAVRPNFRGVGESAGEFDKAVGETADMRELVRQFVQAYPAFAEGKWVLAGFSFGTSVAAQLYSMLEEERRVEQGGVLESTPATGAPGAGLPAAGSSSGSGGPAALNAASSGPGPGPESESSPGGSAALGTVLPDLLILVGSAVERFRFREVVVPDDTLLIHGEVDEVVPLAEAMEFARARNLPVVVVPEATHFFHGKLIVLKRLIQERLAALWADIR